jgi:hypothetical protein
VLEKRMRSILGSKAREVIGVKLKGGINPRIGHDVPEAE